MIFVALSEAAGNGELLLVDAGLCRFHCRRDGVVVIREILVLPDRRREGIGRGLVAEVARRCPDRTLRAVCPADYEANRFWESLGFSIAAYKIPGERQLVVWERRPSSTAPTATPNSPGSR